MSLSDKFGGERREPITLGLRDDDQEEDRQPSNYLIEVFSSNQKSRIRAEAPPSMYSPLEALKAFRPASMDDEMLLDTLSPCPEHNSQTSHDYNGYYDSSTN